MDSKNNKSSLLEYAVKELKQENIHLKDKIDSISKTEIKTREELLKLQSTALEAAANGIVITDIDGNINWVNSAFTQLTGYSKEEAYNQNPRVLKSGIHTEEFYKKLWTTISSGKVWYGEMVNKRKDGTLYSEEMTITPLLNENNEITNFIAIKQDITERKKYQKNLLFNQQSVDNSPFGIIWVNIDSKIIYANKTILNKWGYSFEQVTSLNIADIDPHWPTKDYFHSQIEILRNNDELKFNTENRRSDGSTFPVEVSLNLINYDNEEIIVAHIKDISIQSAIREIEKLILTSDHLHDLLKGMHENISKVISAPNCYMALLDNRTKMVSFPYFVDQNDSPPSPRKMRKGTTEFVIESGQPLLLNNKGYKELIAAGKIEAIGTIPVSWVGIPIYIKSKSSGVLVLQSYDEDLEYSEKDLKWLTSIINLISSSIERKNYEKEIVENEQKFKAITNSTKDAIITANSDREIILWNEAAEQLFGYSEQEALGNSTIDLIIPERFREESRERFDKVLGIGKDFKGTFELIANKKDGTELNVELSVSLTEISNQWYSTGIWRDLSNKKAIQKSTEKEKEEIISELENELTLLKSNYNILNSIIETLPQHIYVKDKSSKFIKVNKSMVKDMGFSSEEEILGKSDHDLFDNNIAKEFLEEEQELMKNGDPIIDCEHLKIKRNGEKSWATKSKFPLFNSEGKSIGTFGITTDLTERKKTEDELKDSHYKFRKLIENSTLGIMRIDEDGEILMANPTLVKMLDYESETELIKLTSDKIYSSINSKKRFLQILQREEKISGYEDLLIKNDGKKLEVRESAWAVKDKHDKIIYYEIIVEDITEQNQILKILHESEFKYRMLIDKLSEAVYLSVDGKLEIVNSKFLDLFEFSEEELYSPNFDINKYMPKKTLLEIKPEHIDNKNDDEVDNTFEVTINTKSGDEKEVEISLSYLNYNGKIAAQGVVRDLTKVRKQETQIRHLQKMESIGTLAAGIAHEINTPSQFVGDNLTFLKETYAEIKPILESLSELESEKNLNSRLQQMINETDIEYLNEEVPSAIDQSIEGIKRIANIVGAMRDFAHTGPKDKVAADIHKIIKNSITLSKNAWKYIAKIETDFADEIPSIVCQPNDVNQVIVNMIVNSSHALEDKFGNDDTVKGKIKIKTESNDEFVVISIKDNGSGMPENVLKRIFDPFYTTKDVGKGTGQGLAIAYDILVTKHGGDIDVTSEEGKGTEFILKLPIVPRVSA